MATSNSMHHEYFDAGRGTCIIKDAAGHIHEIANRQPPWQPDSSVSQTAQRVAGAYLRAYSDVLNIQPDSLGNLTLGTDEEPNGSGVEYRLLEEKSFFDLTTVTFAQTLFGLPIRGAGIAVHIKQDPYRVVGASSTAHRGVEKKVPTARAIRQFRKVTPKKLSRIINLKKKSKEQGDGKLQINRARFLIYLYDAEARLPRLDSSAAQRKAFPRIHPILPLPAVPEGINDGSHYVVSEILFTLTSARWGTLNWIAIVEVETAAVLYLRALVDNVSGMVFKVDPMTATGNPANGPTSDDATLNTLRTSVSLEGLYAPTDGEQLLSGNFVQLSDYEPPNVDPPTESTGGNFDYSVRTNNFAAVNAYYHVDSFFRLVEDLGFVVASYFNGTSFPIHVDHRGRHLSVNGVEINATCEPNATNDGIGQTDFELADIADTVNPLGMACDRRVVLHELAGHGILYDHVGSGHLGFAHSAGDSFAAILNDPGNLAPRFETFPWINVAIDVNRRHDRSVASGWAWGGTKDAGLLGEDEGYNAEQILSSSNFRIYRSIGGDSSRIENKRFAARYMTFLMLRAVATLSPATNPLNATGFASAMMTADQVDWTSEGQSGGAYGKVIRWAFEKQGLYQVPGTETPVEDEGAAPPIDVYIDDGRAGEYSYLANHWSCPNIWNRLAPDDGGSHQRPKVGVSNYAYVKIRNRGTQVATDVVVKGFHCRPSTGLTWPDDWQAMSTAQLPAPDIGPNNSAEIIVGPFEWFPSQPDHECMLMIVSASGDPSNVDNLAIGETIPEWRLVPHDNNIGQRNVCPILGGGGAGALLADFNPKRFVIHNPHRKTSTIEVVPVLPKVLQERGWELRLDSPGGYSFALAHGVSREIVMRFRPGAEFTAKDIRTADERIIQVETYADGILVGGMSYELDPAIKAASSAGQIRPS